MLTWFKAVWAVIAGFFSFLFGGLDGLFLAFLCTAVIDYITGVSAALYQGKLNSTVGFRGILKKVVMLMVIALAAVIGRVLGHAVVRDAVIGFYIANEGISILENAGKMQVPVCRELRRFLEQLREEE
ncbi:MAG: phage holin family protein [Clostridia bacterium]|nr:phage holin family protein [Clostridia bacterium]